MTNPELITRLREMASNLQKYKSELESTPTTCPTCQKLCYPDWDRYKVYQALGAAETKVETAIWLLEKSIRDEVPK